MHDLPYTLLQTRLEEHQVRVNVALAGLKASQNEVQRLRWIWRIQTHRAGQLVCHRTMQLSDVTRFLVYSPQTLLWSASFHCKDKDR